MKVITVESSKATRSRGLTIVYGIHDFALGTLVVGLNAQGLCWLGLNCGEEALTKHWPSANLVRDEAVTKKAAGEIAKLWPARLDALSVPLVLYGTPFQIKIWKQLLKIPAGKTVTYAQLAKKAGYPDAVRAAGSACGKNPISLVVPCHRVVNKDGGIINYGWGPALKKALLKREGAI